jgi:hypothetical protein
MKHLGILATTPEGAALRSTTLPVGAEPLTRAAFEVALGQRAPATRRGGPVGA